MAKRGSKPFVSIIDAWVVQPEVDLARAVESMFYTADSGLCELALAGLSVAIKVNTYDTARLALLQKALATRQEMFQSRNSFSASLVQAVASLMDDVQALIDKQNLKT